MLTARSMIAFALLLYFFVGVDSVKAQTRAQFPKSSRSIGSSVANPKRIQTPAQVQRAAQARQQQSRNRSYSSNRSRQQFNHHSFYPSRSVTGSGYRYSPSQFRGNYVPRNPYVPYAYGGGYGGYGGPVYGNPYGAGYGYGNPGFRNYNPTYATYGSYLNTGGVLGANAIGSSVAAQALQRLRNQQQVLPNQAANTARDAEILRLQIELERAKQQLAIQNQARPRQNQIPQQRLQQTLKPAVESAPESIDNNEVINQLGLAAIIETNQLAATSHLKAERAFRSGNYGQAARFAGLAKSLDESNGKLMLFAAQAHFANGEYRDAVKALTEAEPLLNPEELGYVVQNYKLFYGQNDFVPQMKQLSRHLKATPDDARASLLRGFQYGALGYPDAARKDLTRAKELGANAGLADKLLAHFAVELVE